MPDAHASMRHSRDHWTHPTLHFCPVLDSENNENCNESHGYVESPILVGAHEHLALSIPEHWAAEDVTGVAARRDGSRIDAHALRAPGDVHPNLFT